MTGSATARFQIVAAASDSGDDRGDGNANSGDASDNGVDDSAGDKDDEQTTVISSDDDDVSGADRGDGWSYFEPKVNATTQDTSLLSSVGVPPAVNIAVLVICCMAFAAAIFYATHARKETDDMLPEEHADA